VTTPKAKSRIVVHVLMAALGAFALRYAAAQQAQRRAAAIMQRRLRGEPPATAQIQEEAPAGIRSGDGADLTANAA